MEYIKLKVSTITPALINIKENKPELRPPSFRGMMRYWFRAACGAVIGNNLTELKTLEGLVFGSPERASSFSIQIPLGEDPPISDVELFPHKELRRERVPRNCINAGHSFSIVLKTSHTQNLNLLEAAKLSLQVGLLLGNVGLRSRRGFGTMNILSSKPTGGLELPKFADDSRLIHYTNTLLQSLLKVIKHLAAVNGITTLTTPPSTLLDYPAACTTSDICLSNGRYQTALEAINYFIAHVPAYPSLGSVRPSRQASPLWIRPIRIAQEIILK